MPRNLDLETWARRDAYEFFRTYEQPYFSICAEVDVTVAYEASREPAGPSFFLAVSHRALATVDSIPELRYRIRGEAVVEHERVHLGATIARADDTFGFCYLDFDPRFGKYCEGARPRIREAQEATDHSMEDSSRDDLVYLSVIPWISFTSFEHAMRSPPDSVPRLVFGRHRDVGTRRMMPVSLALHHALADGLHAGRFFAGFQAELDVPFVE